MMDSFCVILAFRGDESVRLTFQITDGVEDIISIMPCDHKEYLERFHLLAMSGMDFVKPTFKIMKYLVDRNIVFSDYCKFE